MQFFGLTIARTKSLAPVAENRGGWWPLVREAFAGAWQRNVEVDAGAVLSFHAVYSCVTLIASDIAKLRVKLVEQDANGIWTETRNPAYTPVLRRPNRTQNRIQFWESWMLSKLLRGNAYILKRRDDRNVVNSLVVLDPSKCRPMVADDGSIFYQLDTDNIAALGEPILVPAREIIHDRWNCLFHPLVGVSPIMASGLAATQGLAIQNASARFFANNSNPGGILSAPGKINDDTALRLKEMWEANHTGANRGRLAVLGDGLKYEKMTVDAVDAQLIEQLKWTAEVVCSTFHVPPYKIGIGPMPTYNNVQALNVEYYSQCLQVLIEAAELCLDEGLATGDTVGTEFDLDGLLRMDSVTQVTAIKEAIGAGFMSPNEGRKKVDLKPVDGGESPYLQQQNYSLEALAKRDAQDDPFAAAKPPAPTPTPDVPALPPPDPAMSEEDMAANAMLAGAMLRRALSADLAA